jgi:hydroxyethylthiazole kinase-like uncharacterized protein yjeF
MQLYTSALTKKIDNLATKVNGVSSYSLMQHAAEFSLNVLLQEWEDVEQLIVFCSKGKNSGDGFLLANYAKEVGIESLIVLVSSTKDLTGSAKKAFQEATASGVKKANLRDLSKIRIKRRAVLVDALIGTGLKGEVRPNIKNAIDTINRLGKNHPILSLDVPSGICSDTGTIKGAAVVANASAVFVTQKRGCFTSDGRTCAGEIFFSDLDIPKRIYSGLKSDCHTLDMDKCLNKIVLRDMNSHKGHFGHVLVIGGNHGYGGAPILTAKAAAKSGAGLVSLATRPEHVPASIASCPEVMAIGINSGQDLEPFLEKPDVIVIGPGLNQTAWSEQLIQRVFWEAEKRNVTVIMDADALNLLSSLKLSAKLPKNLILTPHPGEAAKLLGKTILEIESNRFKAASLLQKKFNAVVVLKGSGSLVCYKKSGKQLIGVCEAGNPGMATGGMGDILAGIIASFSGQGLTLTDATEMAVDVHAKAADLASLEIGEVGLLPSDVLEELNHLLKYSE